jgi:LEA14-like dessication related protein
MLATQVRRTVSLALLALLLGACHTLRTPLEPPDVYVTNLVPLLGGGLEQRVRVDLRLQNPNNREIRLDGIRFTLEVNGQPLARGASAEAITLPRLGESAVSVEATTTLFDILRQVVALPSAQGLDYRISGTVFLRSAWGGRVPFEREGSFFKSGPRPRSE